MQDENFEFNIRPYMMIALGRNTFLHDDIDEIYEKNKSEYYELYRNGGMYDDKSFTIFMIDKEDRMKKIAGITEWCYKHDDFEKVYWLIKKGYKYCWNYFKQRKDSTIQHNGLNTRKNIVLDDFVRALMKRAGGAGKISDIDMFHNEIILMYLCHKENVPLYLNTDYGKFFTKTIRDDLRNYYAKDINFTTEKIEKRRNEIDKIYKEFFISKKNKTITLGLLLENIIQKETESNIISVPINYSVLQDIRSVTFQSGISKYIGAFAGWIRVMTLSEMDLTESLILTNQDIDEVIYEYILAKDENKINELDKKQFIVACFIIKAFSEEYKRAKNIFFNQKQEEFHYELREKNVELQNKEVELKEERQRMEYERKKIEEENNSLLSELKVLQKETLSLKLQMETLEDHSKEVVALRDYIYNLETKESETVEQDLVENMVKELQHVKIAIIGGSQTWNLRLKELFPKFIGVNQDSKAANISFLDNVDYVCINTATLSHSFYEKVMKRMSKNGVGLLYVNGNNNMEITVKNIYRNYKNKMTQKN